MGRPQRLIKLLAALQARRQATAEALASELGVSTRTVLRDVQALIDAGIPVWTERGRYGGISLLPGDQVDLSKLTTTEADLLRALGLDLDRARQLGSEAAARSALSKLTPRRPFPSARGDLPLALSAVVAIDNRPWFGEIEPVFDIASLIRGLRTARQLRIRYRRSGTSTVQDLTVDPYGLVQRGGRWYLIADQDQRSRMFSLSRLSWWHVLDTPRCLRPGADLASTARELSEALENKHSVTVTAHLDADRLDMARRILGSRFKAASAQGCAGRVAITVAYDRLDGVRQLLQFGDHIEVIAPESARQLIHNLATQLARAHASEGGASVPTSSTS